jgi:hypothetical protein
MKIALAALAASGSLLTCGTAIAHADPDYSGQPRGAARYRPNGADLGQ